MIILAIAGEVFAQKQLALVGKGRVVESYSEGTYIRFILKDGKLMEGRIVELHEFSMVTSGDSVPFNKIRKIEIPRGNRKGMVAKAGVLLLIGGAAYLGIDQINRALGYIKTGGEEQVFKTSAILMASGGLLTLMRPRYYRVNEGIFLRTVDYKSPFYRSEN